MGLDVRTVWRVLFVVLPILGTAPVAEAAHAQGANDESTSGEDIIRPTRRVDFRIEQASEGHDAERTITFRVDHPVRMGNRWQLNLRFDVPMKTAETHQDGESGWTGLGLGDALLNAAFIHRTGAEEGFGIGSQLIMPTAGRDEYGRGQWRLRPVAGYRWPVSYIAPGTFFQLVARYDFSIASQEGRGKTRELQFTPNLEIAFPHDLYLSIFPSPDFRYNFVRKELFVPANLEIGKQWGRLVWSLEGAAGVIKGDHPPYDWKVETRLGFKF